MPLGTRKHTISTAPIVPSFHVFREMTIRHQASPQCTTSWNRSSCHPWCPHHQFSHSLAVETQEQTRLFLLLFSSRLHLFPPPLTVNSSLERFCPHSQPGIDSEVESGFDTAVPPSHRNGGLPGAYTSFAGPPCYHRRASSFGNVRECWHAGRAPNCE